MNVLIKELEQFVYIHRLWLQAELLIAPNVCHGIYAKCLTGKLMVLPQFPL